MTQVRTALYRCIEDVAAIWAEMILTYYPDGRLLPTKQKNELRAEGISFSRMKSSLIRSHIDVRNVKDQLNVSTQTVLDKLLEEGHIKADTYVSLLPQSIIRERDKIIESIQNDAERSTAVNGAHS